MNTRSAMSDCVYPLRIRDMYRAAGAEGSGFPLRRHSARSPLALLTEVSLPPRWLR